MIKNLRFLSNVLFVNPFVASYLFFKFMFIKKGKKIWVIGNGPSLNNFDSSKIEKDDFVMTCNYFIHHKKAKDYEIDFYCMSDPRLLANKDYISHVISLKPEYIVSPIRHIFELIFFNLKNKFIFYNYAPYMKLWKKNTRFFKNQNIYIPLQSGDTVAFDIMIPLALSLRPSQINLVGIDLRHDKFVQHAYDESLASGPRSSDEYLTGEWQINTRKSFEILKTNAQLSKIIKIIDDK